MTSGGAAPVAAAPKSGGAGPKSSDRKGVFADKEKPAHIRMSNIEAAKAVADSVRTSLGPKGMDKMIKDDKDNVTITNDGATILQRMKVLHPAARMLVELSKAQDVEAGDGTTTVVVVCGALLEAAKQLLSHGIHPTKISDSFQRATEEALTVLDQMSIPFDLTNREAMIKTAATSLSSKVISTHSQLMSTICCDAVLKVANPDSNTLDLKDIQVVPKVGGTLDDTELVDGLCLDQSAMGTTRRMERAKVALIQFQLSPPKTDMENQVVINDYSQMDRVLKEERQYTLNLVKAIKKSGANVLLCQKSILRDAVSDLAIHYLNKLKILVVKDIERDQVPFVCKTLGCKPVASPDHFTPESLASVDMVEEVQIGGGNNCLKFTGIQSEGKTVSLLIRASNENLLAEAERSIHDALCVLRCLVKKRALVAGGGAVESQLALKLGQRAKEIGGVDGYCLQRYADALEVIPYTLAENAALNPIEVVTELRKRHNGGEMNVGINVRKAGVSDMVKEEVVQPLLVSSSMITLATETVRSILKIDDIVNVVGR
jgi:T-complex protein 1 subunit delta